MVREAPLRHDRAAARHDAGDAVRGERHIGEAHAGVDGEVVDALLALLDQRVLVDLPVELDGIAVDLLQRLVDRHGADRHRRIADDPFARGVDVAAGGEVHHGVGAPADRPHHLLDLLLDRRRHRGVADVGVDLGEEVAADDHRLELGVIDVRGNDRAAARHFRAHELRRHEGRHRCAEALAVGERGLRALELDLAAEVLARRDVDHLLGDDAGARPFELGHRLAGECAQRTMRLREHAREMLVADAAIVLRLDDAAFILLDAAALAHPLDPRARQPGIDVDRRIGIGVGAGRIVDRHRRLGGSFRQHHLAHGNAQIRRRIRRDIDFARARDGSGGDFGGDDAALVNVHWATPWGRSAGQAEPGTAPGSGAVQAVREWKVLDMSMRRIDRDISRSRFCNI